MVTHFLCFSFNGQENRYVLTTAQIKSVHLFEMFHFFKHLSDIKLGTEISKDNSFFFEAHSNDCQFNGII